MKTLSRLVLMVLLALATRQTSAQSNDFGVHGVLDVPTARMPGEGIFTTTYSRKRITDIYAISYQPLPWLEAAFRYTVFNARKYSTVPGERCFFGSGNCDDGRDRSFEVKARLIEETDLRPQVSVGVRDLVGTGAWGSEYLVASKQLGALDLSVGMGWGRLAERDVVANPLAQIDDRFATRGNDSGLGGTLATRLFFRGERVGLFGSATYELPDSRGRLLLAYNSDSYARERSFGTIKDAEPLSLGYEWRSSSGISLSISRQQGNQWAFRLSAALDSAAEPARKAPNGFGAQGVELAEVAEEADNPSWWPRMASDSEESGILLRAYHYDPAKRSIHFQYSNGAYAVEADAANRVLSLAKLYAPVDVEKIVLTGDTSELTTHSITYYRRHLDLPPIIQDAGSLDISAPIDMPAPTAVRQYQYPNVLWSLNFEARGYLFDPDFPFLYQVSGRVGADVDFGKGWTAAGSWVQAISSQFDRIERESDSALPPVRSLLKNYLQEGQKGVDYLVLTKRGQLSSDVYYQAFGGILEEMYAGVGAEVLWRSVDKPVAFGINAMAVRQRDFDRMFGLRDYKTVTGHASVYWTAPMDFDVAVHAGRYLARDWGATLEVQKRFANGWTVGAFATLTNVPFKDFGEGSFDKGLLFRIPFDLYSPKNTRGGYRMILRPINRDGGRMVDYVPGSLWEHLRPSHGGWLRKNADRMSPD